MTGTEADENVAVTYETDVVVLGGGPAGVGAALSAARRGCDVMVIEQTNALGGIATSGLHGHVAIYSAWGSPSERIVGGVAHELAETTVDRGYGTYCGHDFDFEVEPLKLILEEKFVAADINFLYHTLFCDVVMDGDRVEKVIIQNKTGRQAIRADMVIDCTGDGDVAARAGAPFEVGRQGDGATQPMTLMFQIGGVDYDRFKEFRENGYVEKYGASDTFQMSRVWEEAQQNGDMEPFQSQTMGFWWTPTRPDQLGVNFTHIVGRDCRKTEDLTYATVEGRRQAFHMIDVFRKYVPGLEDCWMSHCAALIGTRESRRVMGDYVITAEDVTGQREFEDSIGYGSFFIDIHNCSGAGMDEETWRPPEGFKYQIPYRSLIPRGLSNLLVAGRCISCTHRALGSLRVMAQCIVTGEAAGLAAQISQREGCSVHEIDVARLQEELRAQNAIVGPEGIGK